MILKNGNELDLNLKFRKDFINTVFVSTDSMRCFGCGKTKHLICAFPDSSANVNKPGVSGAQRKAINSDDADEITPTDAGLTVELTAAEMRNEQTAAEEHDVKH